MVPHVTLIEGVGVDVCDAVPAVSTSRQRRFGIIAYRRRFRRVFSDELGALPVTSITKCRLPKSLERFVGLASRVCTFVCPGLIFSQRSLSLTHNQHH